MPPCAVTSAHRGGNFYAGYGASSFPRNSVYSQPRDRGYTAPRGRFAVSTDPETGEHHIELNDHEAAAIALDSDGAVTVTAEDKPAMGENGAPPGGDDAAPASPAVLVEVESSLRRSLLGRLVSAAVQRMSWEADGDGGYLITPGDNEAVSISGDSSMAVVVAVPPV